MDHEIKTIGRSHISERVH